MNKNIIEQETNAREWVQKEVINKRLKLYNADSPQSNSNFQVIYFGLDNNVNSSTLDYIKEKDIFFIVGVITHLKVQNFGWFSNLADFLWDKSKNKIETDFTNLSKEEREIFLFETTPYFNQTKPYIELKKIYEGVNEKKVADPQGELLKNI